MLLKVPQRVLTGRRPPITYSPTMRRRRLSQLLKDLRRKAGITATQAAEQLGWDPAKVSRIERNEWKLPNPRDVRDLLDLYGVTDEKQREMLLDLAKQARQRGWW